MNKFIIGLIFFFALSINSWAQLTSFNCQNGDVSVTIGETRFVTACYNCYFRDKSQDGDLYIVFNKSVVNKFALQNTYQIYISPKYNGESASLLLWGKLVEMKIDEDRLICVFNKVK
jgi:hypothetical protein